jgi:uncharacterized protein YutE (UPF0331/DUF86 family)
MMASGAEARERAVLEILREKYEDDGYSFFAYPPASVVPGFLQDYRPDAIAVRGEERVVIEIRQRSQRSEPRLSRIAERFAAHPDWRFVVVYPDDVVPDLESLGLSSAAEIEAQLREAEQLSRAKHHRAAFVLGWAIIEALARALQGGKERDSSVSRSPRELVEILERNGFIGFEDGRRLRDLVRLRNATVHGDFGVAVDQSAVEQLLQVARRLDAELRAVA